MWTLPLPSNLDALDQLKKSLTLKSGEEKYSLNQDELEDIKNSYKLYEELKGKGSQELLESSSLCQGALEAIHNAYSEIQENRRLSSLRDSLLISAKRCPCCSIGSADELDHHLPRSVYKFLAVYSSNLVPMCHKCNNKKRTVSEHNTENGFIHVYYDKIPVNDRFLIATTTLSNGVLLVEYTIRAIPSLDEDVCRKMKFQIERINFNDRVMKEINIFLGSFLVALNMVYEVNRCADNVAKFLADNEKVFCQQFGVNDWRASLLSSLAMNYDFCNGGFKIALGSNTLGNL